MEKCPHCGQEIEELTVRCTYCGLSIKSDEDIQYDANRPPKGFKNRKEENDYSWATRIIIFVMIVVFFLLFKIMASAIGRHFEKNIDSRLEQETTSSTQLHSSYNRIDNTGKSN